MIRRRTFLAAGAAGALAAGGIPAALAQGAPATLRFSWWGGNERHQLTLKAIEAFEARHPGVKIKAEYGGWQGYLERLTTQIAGGTEPDVMQLDWAWLSMFSKNGDGFLDLAKHPAQLGLDQFGEDALRVGSVKGKLNALPASFTARVFVWNRSAFDKAGLQIPRTWDELFALGPQVRAKLGDKAYVLDGDGLDMLLLAHTYAQQKHGQPYVHPTEPKVAMSPEAVRDWVAAYKRITSDNVGVPQPYRASLGGADKPTEQQPDWVNGNWLGYCAWDSATRLRTGALAAGQQAEIGPFLTLPDAKSTGMLGRAAMVLAASRNTKHPQLAAQFIGFLLTDAEASRILVNSRGIPLARSQFRQLVAENRIGAVEMQAYEQIRQLREAGKVTQPSPLFEHARVNKFVRDVFEQVAYGKANEEQAAARLLGEGNLLLARVK
ncbi:ABC transporter substrate-binding protein [Caldimonas tepidiphila]|uniref:ABC transporter substrate-binding protein n=1 Tax=Caldimonas tepidiphila TaxID=2315841 RepID=UPI000E5B35DD|nr:ABC transporter substrate-binding protein [Caldimonas tepidiphila]